MVIATGYFDGVHLGHKAILESLCSYARQTGDKSMVITFYPHPRVVLQKGASTLRFVSSRAERDDLLKGCGVDYVKEIEFTREFAAMSAAEYISYLVREFDCRALVLGYDNRFGSDSLPNEDLYALLKEAGIKVLRPEVVEQDGIVVSSSMIRRALRDGQVDLASSLLSRPYSLKGVVVAGRQLGRQIGFPTANMQLYDPLKIVPANGVYRVRVRVLGREYIGMTNIGVRPTVSGGPDPSGYALQDDDGHASQNAESVGTLRHSEGVAAVFRHSDAERGARSEESRVTIETNIFDFNEDIYGLDIEISFIARIRGEKKFESLTALSAALSADRDWILYTVNK